MKCIAPRHVGFEDLRLFEPALGRPVTDCDARTLGDTTRTAAAAVLRAWLAQQP